MTFLGPLKFINADGSTMSVVGWEEAQSLWASQIGGKSAKSETPKKVKTKKLETKVKASSRKK